MAASMGSKEAQSSAYEITTYGSGLYQERNLTAFPPQSFSQAVGQGLLPELIRFVLP